MINEHTSNSSQEEPMQSVGRGRPELEQLAEQTLLLPLLLLLLLLSGYINGA